MRKRLIAILIIFGILVSFGIKAYNEQVSNISGKNYTDILTKDKVIFLTLDAHTATRKEIKGARDLLDFLRVCKIKATLFLTAEFVEQAPEIVMQAIDDGHEIASHLKTHTSPGILRKRKCFNKAWFIGELLATQNAVRKISKKETKKFFRLPFGIKDYSVQGGNAIKNLLKWAGEQGYVHFNWSVDTYDWVKKDAKMRGFPYLSARQVKSKVFSYIKKRKKGPIILAHLVRYREHDEDGPKEMVNALMALTQRSGYRFAQLGEYVKDLP